MLAGFSGAKKAGTPKGPLMDTVGLCSLKKEGPHHPRDMVVCGDAIGSGRASPQGTQAHDLAVTGSWGQWVKRRRWMVAVAVQ